MGAQEELGSPGLALPLSAHLLGCLSFPIVHWALDSSWHLSLPGDGGSVHWLLVLILRDGSRLLRPQPVCSPQSLTLRVGFQVGSPHTTTRPLLLCLPSAVLVSLDWLSLGASV